MPAFDVFLSYSRADSETVEQMGRALRERHLAVFVDRWHLVAGQSWPAALEKHLHDCRAVAVCIGATGMSGWQQREHYEALDRQARDPDFRVIPVLLPGADDPALGFLGLNTWVDMRGGIDDAAAMDALARAVRGLPPGAPAAPVADARAEICPYRGLLPFREEDAPFFFGREAFTAQLIDQVRQQRLVAVVGASGCGKSSVVHAGLVPALRRGADGRVWEVLTLAPGRTPLHALMAALSPAPGDASRAARLGRIESDVALLRRHELGIEAFARDILQEQPGTDRLLLLVDQWEELYTQASSPHDRERFVRLILDAAAADTVTVVLTLRGDFYGRALEDRALADRLHHAVVNLGPMLPEELRRAVVEPAAKLGVGFDDGLVDRILADVGGEPGHLPLLEFLLTQLWSSRERGTLTHSAYAAIGGVRGGIATRAEAELRKLTAEQRDALRRVMLRLVSSGEGAALARVRAPLPKDAAAAEAVRVFADARLLTTGVDEATGLETVEVSHEALIREWNTLRAWIDADREFIRTVDRIKGAMRAWNEESVDKDSRLLAPGRPLEEARELLARPHVPIDDIRPFIEASIARDDQRLAEERAHADAERQREIEQARKLARIERGRRRIAVAGLVATLVLAVGAAISWWKAMERETRLLAHLAVQATQSGDAIEGIRLALQGFPAGLDRLAPSLVNEAAVALDGALHTPPYHTERILRGHQMGLLAAAFAPDGRSIVTASADRTARVWDASKAVETAVLRGHDDVVTSAAYSSDGKTVVTGSRDKTARLWDAATGRQTAVLHGHEDAVLMAAFNRDGSAVVTVAFNPSAMLSTREHSARLWDPASGRQTATLQGHDGAVISATFSPDGRTVMTTSLDKTARLWEVASGAEIAVLRHDAAVVVGGFSPDGKLIVTAPYGKPPRLWDVATKKEIGALRGQEGASNAVAFSPDGRLLVMASFDHAARIWETATGKPIATLRGHEGIINSVAFSPDAGLVLTGSVDGSARLWDSATGRQTAELRGHRGAVTAASFSPDGAAILTAAADDTARLWRASRGRAELVLRGHGNSVNFADFSPDGKRVLTASWDGTARLWDTDTDRTLVLRGHLHALYQAVFSRDARFVVTASEDQTARVWDAASGMELAVLRGHTAHVAWATFSPDGASVATASGDGTARLWDRHTGRQTGILRGHDGVVFTAQFSPDGRTLLTASHDKTARVWERSTAKEIAVLRGHREPLAGAGYSPDGKLILTVSRDKTARLWNAATHEEIAVLEGHEAALTSGAVSRDGLVAATASDDGTARLWEVATGRPLAVLRGHDDRVNRVRISPDGRIVATTSADKTARLWEAATGRATMTLRGHGADVHAGAFSPDGKALVTGSADGTARVWRTDRPALGALVSEACRRLAQVDQAPTRCRPWSRGVPRAPE